MIFKGWQKTSLIEYPGKIASVLFVSGCNFRCPFCYNPDLVLNSESLPDLSDQTVCAYLRENRPLYQAVVITGGEPTLDPDLPAFLNELKAMDLSTGIETNGTNPDMLESLIKDGDVDFIAMDVKAPLDEKRYQQATGVSEKKFLVGVRESIKLILQSGVDYEFRTTVVPGIHCAEDVSLLSNQLNEASRYVLQSFVPGNALQAELNDTKPFPRDTLAQWQERVEMSWSR